MFESPTIPVAIITTGGTVVVAVIGALVEFIRRQSAGLSEMRDHVTETRNQVANTHDTNLRDDMDRQHEDVRAVLAAVERQGEDIAHLREEMQGVRAELLQERGERMALAQRLDHHLVRIHVV